MSEVEALQNQLTDAHALVDRREKALKLFNNPEFKEIILDGFCLKDCARYAQSSEDPALDANARADSLNIAQASGHLRRFLSVIIQMGNAAAYQIPSIEQAILEIQHEGGDE